MSLRPFKPGWLEGDEYEYNGPFRLDDPQYSRSRNAGIPIDVPFDPSLLDPDIAESLNKMLSSIKFPEKLETADSWSDSGSESGDEYLVRLRRGKYCRKLSDQQKKVVNDWVSPINGQEDNLAGLGGNWDYVKWNAMVIACYYKQIQLGYNLGRLVRVHPPVEVYYNNAGEKEFGVMGKDEYLAAYGVQDIEPPAKPKKVKKVVRKRKKSTKVTDKGAVDDNDGNDDDDDDSDEKDNDKDKEGEEDVPDWRKVKPAPTGSKRAPDPLEQLYDAEEFLPLDKDRKWVPPKKCPDRNLVSLLETSDPLYGILKQSAEALTKQRMPKPTKKKTPAAKMKKDDGDSAFKPDSEPESDDSEASKGKKGAEKSGLKAAPSRVDKLIRYKRVPARRSRMHFSASLRLRNEVLRKPGVKFHHMGLRMASARGTRRSKTKTSLPYLERDYSRTCRRPNFARKKWPTLKKNLQSKRWHLMPVAYNVNGEMRWWLVIIDMQIQMRPQVDTSGKETGKPSRGRAVWVFNPLGQFSAATMSTDPVSYQKALSLAMVPSNLCELLNGELKSLDHHLTPVEFPRSMDKDMLAHLGNKTLPAHCYDHPGRFRSFELTTISGHRYNHQHRNPQTGIDIIYAMDRVLHAIEQEDARVSRLAEFLRVGSRNLWCVNPTELAGEPRIANITREGEQLQSMAYDSFQNRVRDETMVEIQRFMEQFGLKGYPFYHAPDRVPEEGYRIVNMLYERHRDIWDKAQTWFERGAHGVIIGVDDNKCPKHGTCVDPTPHVVVIPMGMNTYVVLHGKKKRHPFDDPKSQWWGTAESLTSLKDLSAEEQDSKKRGHLYKRTQFLRHDIGYPGPMPLAGGPSDARAILRDEYPQSMISLIIDKKGKGMIQVGNRPNSIWKVNGVQVYQSQVIDRFSHVTYLYGNGRHWLFLRRFAMTGSFHKNLKLSVPGDIHIQQRPKNIEIDEDSLTLRYHDPLRGKLGGADMNIFVPESTYLTHEYKKYTYEMGNDTPHLHHHHRPVDIESASQVEKLLWQSHVSKIFLCQNPVCTKSSRTIAGKEWVAAPNPTSIPCFDPSCVKYLPETRVGGVATCFNVNGGKCLPDTEGNHGGHVPGIPGHMFLETGVLLFQPELVITDSSSIIDTRGANDFNNLVGDDDPDFEKPQDRSILPQPPLSWSRVAFAPIGRFPSLSAAKEYLRSKSNYEPILLSERETAGVAYDMTLYERINYYRLLLWNRLPPKIQDKYWREHYQDEHITQHCSSYSVKADPETRLRLGFQQEQGSSASGEASIQDGTKKDESTKDTTIIGAGDSYMWNLIHGHLVPNYLPYCNSAGLTPEDLPYQLTGLVSAKQSLIEAEAATKPASTPPRLKEAGIRGIFRALLDRIRKRPKIKSKSKLPTPETSTSHSSSSSNHSSPVYDASVSNYGSKDEIAPTNKLATIHEEDSIHGSEDVVTDESESEMNESQKDCKKIQPLATSTPGLILHHGIDSIANHTSPDFRPHNTRQVKFQLTSTPELDTALNTPVEGDNASSSNRTTPWGSVASEKQIVNVITGVDGKQVTFYDTDTLVPFKFYTPFENGVLEEHCIKLFRPGRNSPIMLRAKQIYIPKGSRNTKQWREIEAQIEHQKTERGETAEGRNYEGQDEWVEKSKPASKSVKPLPKSKPDIETREQAPDEMISISEENIVNKKVEPLTVIKEEPETPLKPKAKRGRKPGTAKRKMEDGNYEAPPQPKRKRGRKKKVNADGLAYTEDNVDIDLITEDAILDEFEQKPLPKKTPGRPRRSCQPKDLKEM
ncbi:hypothetical protein TWF694_006697 [Orbilia ellipsospora]|uniref:Uncharacterized protein n=1 Tax=Orbilia ellipsospora TaxID=2528407 RepID=A0AAV9XM96_9PEZI